MSAAAFYLHRFASAREHTPLPQSLSLFPAEISSVDRDSPTWRLVGDEEIDNHTLKVLGVNQYLVKNYLSDQSAQPVQLYIGYYASQRSGATIHSPKNCLPGGGWEVISSNTRKIDLANGEAIEVNQYIIQKDLDRQALLYWYHSQGAPIAGEYRSRFHTVLSAIKRNRTDGALIRISAPVTVSLEETIKQEAHFIRAIYPILQRFLPGE